MELDDPPFDFLDHEEENDQRRQTYVAAWSRAILSEKLIAEAMGRHLATLIDCTTDADLWRLSDELVAALERWTDIPKLPDVPPHLLPQFLRGAEKWAENLRWFAAQAGQEVLRIQRDAGVQQRDYRQLQERKDWHIGCPAPQPYGVSDRGAEYLVAAWLSFLGLDDAEVTQYGNDGGIDVTSATHIAQVKNYARSRSVGVAEMREFAGVAAIDQRIPMFFTSGKYAAGAIVVADRAGIATFIYDAEAGELQAMNPRSRHILHWGIPSPPMLEAHITEGAE